MVTGFEAAEEILLKTYAKAGKKFSENEYVLINGNPSKCLFLENGEAVRALLIVFNREKTTERRSNGPIAT